MGTENTRIVIVKGLIINNDKILIIKRNKDDSGGGNWETAGGKVELNETLEEALIREIKEETGMVVRIDRLLYATDLSSEAIILTYLCHCENMDVRLSFEHNAFRWIDKNELKDYLSPDAIRDFEQYQVFSIKELT